MSENKPLATSGFLGKGWAFPPSFDRENRRAAMVSEVEDIRQSLNIILSTTPGERFLQPSFGCSIKKMVFETVNESVLTKVKDAVERAILFFEPRIQLDSVDVDTEDDPASPNSIYQGIMQIHIHYTIRATNTRSNMVFPFYFAEADHPI